MNKFLLMSCFFFSIGANGQPLVKTFFDRNGKAADSALSFYYQTARNGDKLVSVSDPHFITRADKKAQVQIDTLLSYYTSTGKIRDLRIFVDGSLEGNFTAFHENGKIKEKGLYRRGSRIGYFSSWYEQGIPEETVQYLDSMKTYFPWPKVIDHWDSLAEQEVINGNGFCHCYSTFHVTGDDSDKDEKKVREEGKIVNGLKDSVWLSYRGNTLLFQETYQQGRFIEGDGYANGKKLRFTELREIPEFPRGIEAMMRFIQNNMVYPRAARRRGSEGRVFVGFVVNTNGKISDIEVLKGIATDCDKEAVRVVSIMPSWTPGKLRGELVRVRFVLPINFKLVD